MKEIMFILSWFFVNLFLKTEIINQKQNVTLNIRKAWLQYLLYISSKIY